MNAPTVSRDWDVDTIRRVARFHASNPGCTPFDLEAFGPKTWRGHLEHDLEEMVPRKRRSPPGEVAAIVAFLSEPAA